MYLAGEMMHKAGAKDNQRKMVEKRKVKIYSMWEQSPQTIVPLLHSFRRDLEDDDAEYSSRWWYSVHAGPYCRQGKVIKYAYDISPAGRESALSSATQAMCTRHRLKYRNSSVAATSTESRMQYGDPMLKPRNFFLFRISFGNPTHPRPSIGIVCALTISGSFKEHWNPIK
jgi:hypothetical protein